MVHQGRDIVQDTDAVELSFRPTRTDFLRGIQVRDRVRRLAPARWALTVLFAGFAVLFASLGPDSAVSVVLTLVCAVTIWGTPRIQANHAFRTVSWQGEYRATVTDAGITTATDHVTLTQRWSVFRGYRENRDHVVLLSRDPNILLVEVLPKRGLRTEQDVQRLRALLAEHVPRV